MNKLDYYRIQKVAQSYEQDRFSSPAGHLTHKRELAAIQSAFQSDEQLLELACGTGRLLREMHHAGRDVTGIEQSPAMVDAGEKGLRIVTGDVFHMPFKSGSFDGAYCFRFTNHYSDLAPFFQECSRILRPGGHLLFDVMHWSGLHWDSAKWGGANYPVKTDVLKEWLREADLEPIWHRSLFPIGPYWISRLPLNLARCLIKLGELFPERFQAISLWYVQKRLQSSTEK